MNEYAVGLWIVVQTVMPSLTSSLMLVITYAQDREVPCMSRRSVRARVGGGAGMLRHRRRLGPRK